jgi:hypothetical protein
VQAPLRGPRLQDHIDPRADGAARSVEPRVSNGVPICGVMSHDLPRIATKTTAEWKVLIYHGHTNFLFTRFRQLTRACRNDQAEKEVRTSQVRRRAHHVLCEHSSFAPPSPSGLDPFFRLVPWSGWTLKQSRRRRKRLEEISPRTISLSQTRTTPEPTVLRKRAAARNRVGVYPPLVYASGSPGVPFLRRRPPFPSGCMYLVPVSCLYVC